MKFTWDYEFPFLWSEMYTNTIAALARAAYDGYNDEVPFTTVVAPQPPHLVSEIVLEGFTAQ